MNKKKSILESNVLYTIVAIIAGFLVGAIFLLIAGISPAVAYGKLFDSIFSKPKYLVWTLVYASPLIFTGLSVAFSFRTGVFNIGAEGQFVIGSLVACVLGIVLKLPPVLHALVCLVAAAAAGCIWSLIVGVLKVKRGIHEVLSFIMFNWTLAKSCKYRSSILKSSYLPVPFISGTNAGEKSRVKQNKTRYSVHTVFISSFAVPGNESKGVYP